MITYDYRLLVRAPVEQKTINQEFGFEMHSFRILQGQFSNVISSSSSPHYLYPEPGMKI